MGETLVLIGCSKTKLPYTPDRKRGGRITAREMYGGQLFRKRVQYADRRGLKWKVLSARYGVWDPVCERKPYELTMSKMHPADRAAWHAHAAYMLTLELLEPMEQDEVAQPLRPGEMTIEIHAGKYYAQPLAAMLESLGFSVKLPCAGLGIGQQLALYTSGELS